MMFKKKLLLAILLTGMLLLQLPLLNLSYAQDVSSEQKPAQSGEQGQASKPQPDPTPSCKLLNPQGQLGGWITTMIEEQIAVPNATPESNKSPDAVIIECIRVSGPGSCQGAGNTGSQQTQICSEYKEVGEVKTCPTGSSCQRVQVFFAKSGTSLLYSYIGLIYRWAAGTIGIICVILLVVSGLQITVAGDNAGKIDEAKERITQSLAGLALLFLSAVILYTINPNFFTF